MASATIKFDISGTAKVEALVAAVKSVMELHADRAGRCYSCAGDYDRASGEAIATWPCETAAVLQRYAEEHL